VSKIRKKAIPTNMLHPIIKPWPFRGWGLDFIGEIHPSSTKGHRFILMVTDYFSKWVEAVPLRNMTHREVISFVSEHIIHRFDIPQTLTTDQGTSFMSQQFREFASSLNIKILNLSPYYAQANGQAEASNKRLKDRRRRPEGVNGSQSKFLKGTWSIFQNRPDAPLF
jgi:transposase InsO family protein